MSELRVLDEPARKTPLYGSFDVVVLGGGPAGLAAAVASSRNGARTLLIERYGFLGGMGTAAGVTNFCGLYANCHGRHERVVRGIADELLAEIARLDGLKEPHLILGKILAQAYDTAAYKIAADRLLESAGTHLLLHSLGCGVVMASPSTVDAVLVETKSGRRAVRGKVFVDASGDGDLAFWAGASYELGDGHGAMMYPSTMFRINDVAPDAARQRVWEKIPAIMEDVSARTGQKFPRKGPIVRPQRHESEWRANLTQVANSSGVAVSGIDVDELTRGEVEGRRQVREAFLFLRENVTAFESAYIVDIPPQLGIRETRRILGDYQLSESDVLTCANFPDSIGVNSWPVEDHVVGDVIFRWPDIPASRGFNQLPYRMLLPQRLDNLFVVGRCASMTHGGQSAARVSGACFVMGQAAGSAAAMLAVADLKTRQIDLLALRSLLTRDGVFLGDDYPRPENISAEARALAQVPTPST
jgi:hypothetical protein